LPNSRRALAPIALVLCLMTFSCGTATLPPASGNAMSPAPSGTTTSPASSGNPTSPASPADPPPSTYTSNVASAGQWIATHSTLPDGAILYSATEIVPYYSNIAAIGMTKDSANYPQVRAWMEWYIHHLSATDVWDLGNSIYDYDVSGTVETPRNTADSTDSYPATFMTLAWRFYRTGDIAAQSYVTTILPELDLIGQQLVKTQQVDGLTWAKPNYQIKYLMNNCEGYRGMRDLASLFQAVGNNSRASYYTSHADLAYQGLMGMWLGDSFAIYRDVVGNLALPSWSTWYPDATSQLFAVLEGVLPASDPKAEQVYAKFNSAWPGWPVLSFNATDPFPWVLVSNAAATMGDSSRVNAYLVTIQDKYVNNGYPWPWYSMEAGWFMRVNAFMAGSGF
jgi:hypothetical protein